MLRFFSTIIVVAIGVITGELLIKNGRKIVNFVKGGKFEFEMTGKIIPPEEEKVEK